MKRTTIPRPVSESKLSSMQADVNHNVSWFNGAYVWPTYVLLIVMARVLVFYFASSILSTFWQWTATSILHFVGTFLALHWARGSPLWEDQGEHVDQTCWEQIDNGVPWTDTRKFFMIVPIVLFLVVSHFTDYDKTHLFINGAILAVLLIAKFPEMHGVRLFRINKATVDDAEATE